MKNFLALLLFVCSLHLFSQETFDVYDGKTVRKISVIFDTNNENLEESRSIQSRLTTKSGDVFSSTSFDEDLKMLAKNNRSVIPQVKIEENELEITIYVYPKTVLSKIVLGPERADLRLSKKKILAACSEAGLEKGQPYDSEIIASSVANIKDAYVRFGYYDIRVFTREEVNDLNQGTLFLDIYPGPKGFVHEVDIEGVESAPLRHRILELVQTKKLSMISFLTGSGKVDRALLEQDQLIILHYLQNKGYLDAEVEIEVQDLGKNQRKVIIHVKLGERYYFGNIRFEGNTFFEPDRIREVIEADIQSEKPYSQEELMAMAKKLKEFYGEEGMIETSVQFVYEYNFETNRIDILFVINESKVFKVGRIIIRGNSSTETRIILSQCELIPGQVYRSSQLQYTQYRLQSLNYFKTVDVVAVKEPSKTLGDEYRDVIIDVQEKGTGTARLFFGFNSTENVYGGLDISENNFNHKGLLNWWHQGISKIRGGGERLGLKAQIGAKEQSYSLQWTDPNFYDSNWRVGFDVTYGSSKVTSNEYTIDSIVFQLFAGYPIARYTSIGLKGRMRDSFTRVKASAPPAVQEQKGNNGIVGGAGPNFSYDSTDNAFRPHSGARFIIDTEVDGVVRRQYEVPRSFPLIRLASLNSIYYPLGKRATLKLRGEYKVLIPVGKGFPQAVPLSERFFLGGVDSVRGIKPGALGPLFPADAGAATYPDGSVIDVAQGNPENPTGGVTSLLLSLEVALKIAKPIDGFLFLDAGSISLTTWQIGQFVPTGGAGVRLDIGRGAPVTVGVGFPLRSDGGIRKVSETVFFSMGTSF
ncbi:MAG: BamA/OMP85 family outer membrane protein [Chlamydiia bacterium]